ncbi:MAG: hypothetical protein KJP00_11520 [Bacteroidia bacterium]|nr:hypothetical protein [Bacteroidia bacterium]
MKFYIHRLLLLALSTLLHIGINAQTTVRKTDGKWTLLVDEQPYEIKGATFGYAHDVNNYDQYFEDLEFLGVNTIRTWASDENTETLLDAANKYDIKVMVGIWMRHGRPGMEDDDSFDYLKDKAGMEVMYANAINTVEQYKDHPALLTWGIGNEVYLNTATDEEKKAYSELLESICKQIKSIDPNHPITSIEAWTFGLDWWQKYVPSIDIYGLNSYGPGAGYLSGELEKKGIDKPYIITEFGVMGEWDIQEENNGIKKEPTDRQKYDAIATGFHEWISNKPSSLGGFVFHYGNGDDFVASWLFTHFKGLYRPQYWAIREAFTGNKPINNVPAINRFELPNTKTKSNTWVPISLDVSDVENEVLEFKFFYNQRTGSRKRRNQILPLTHRGNILDGFEIQLPKEDGPIKVYAAAKDTYSNVGIASTSMVVSDAKAKARKYLVPKASLPFYVYADNINLPYIPSGYMGNYEAIEVDLNNTEEVYFGKTAIKISYKARDNWYGVGFVDPANDWGDILGGYDLSGANTFSFWAKSNDSNVIAKIGFGLIGSDKPFPDTAKESIEIKLTKKWKKYIIKTKKLDLSCIRSGLVITSIAYGFPHDIYIDEVVFQ